MENTKNERAGNLTHLTIVEFIDYIIHFTNLT